MRNRILFLLCFLCIGLQAFAQISISGKVVDAGGLELPGVNVMVKGTTIGTLTDGDGRFTIPDVPGIGIFLCRFPDTRNKSRKYQKFNCEIAGR